MEKGLDVKKLEELFETEQELDIPIKDRFHNTLSAGQLSELTATKGSYSADQENKNWKPKVGGKYWTATNSHVGKGVFKQIWQGTELDETIYKAGEVFKTKKEAQMMLWAFGAAW